MAEVRRYRRKDGKFTYRVRVYGPDGSRLRKTFRTIDEAKKWARAIETDRDRGTFLDPRLGKTTVAEMATRWITSLDVELKTLEDYQSLWRTHVAPAWGHRRLDSLKPLEVKVWARELRASGLSRSRIRKAHLVLRKIFDEAVENGFLARSPVPPLKLRKDANTRSQVLVPPTAIEVCTVALAAKDAQVVGKHAECGYDVLILVGLDSGLRPGELRALKRERCHLGSASFPYLEVVEAVVDVYGHGPVWKDPKDHEQRVVRLSPSVASLLQRHLDDRVAPHSGALVFSSLEGDLLHWGNFNKRVWHRALDAAGLQRQPIRSLRHACGSTLARAAVPLHEVKAHLGHASITTTEQYLHLYPLGGGTVGLDLVCFKEQDIFRTLCSVYFDEVSVTGPLSSTNRHLRP